MAPPAFSEKLDRLLSGTVAAVLGTKILLFLWMVAFLFSGHVR